MRTALGWLLAYGDVEQELHLAATLLEFWHVGCYFSEGRRWLDAGLARPETVTSEVRMTALRAAAVLTMIQGDQVRTPALLDELLPLTRATVIHC